MSVRIVSQMNRLQMEGSMENKDAAKEGMEDAIKQQKSAIKDTYDARMTKIKEDEEARGWSNFGKLFGTIFLGPVIGTLIGWGLGELAGLSSKKDANAANKEAGLADLRYGEATDRFDDAKGKVEDAAAREQEVDKFSRELHEIDWVGTT